MIVKKLRTIFIHIPKTAGTSIEIALANAARFQCGSAEEIKRNPEIARSFGLFCYYPEYLVREIQHIPATVYRYLCPEYDKYFKFAFVRNPYFRAASEFYFESSMPLQPGFNKGFDKEDTAACRKQFKAALCRTDRMLKSRRFAAQKQIELFEPNRKPSWLSIRLARLKHVLRETKLSSLLLNPRIAFEQGPQLRPYIYHWLPQTYFLQDEVDFIGRVENLAEEIKIVEDHLKTKLHLSSFISNVGPVESDRYRELYTDETIRLVNRLYREDFERFGYDFWS